MGLKSLYAVYGAVTPPELDFTAITDALTGSVNVGTIGTVVAAVLTGSIGLAVFWFGGRKIVNAIMRAFKSGKIGF